MTSSETAADALNSDPNPGRMLIEAREAKNLSAVDLAHRLRLDTETIIALEKNDYEKLAGATFIKGYTRSIAKELNIDPEPIIIAYHAISGEQQEPSLADFESRPPPQISSNSAIVKMGSYGLAIVSVLLVIFWWQSNSSDEPSSSLDGESAKVSTGTPLPYDFKQIVHSDQARFPPSTVFTNETPDGDLFDKVETPEPLAGETLVSLTTTAEAWIEIYEDEGERKFFGMAKADVPIKFKSEKPLNFLIGNTRSVTLTINERNIDLNARSREGVARFKFPEESQDSAPPANQ